MKKSCIFVVVIMVLFAFTASATNLALKKSYAVNIPPDANYPDAGKKELTNGVRASASIYDGGWSGYLREEYRVFVVDLEAAYKLDSIMIGLLQDIDTGVHLPSYACFATSIDGRRWRSVDTLEFEHEDFPKGITTFDITANVSGTQARFVAIKLEVGTWLFADEIVVMGDLDTKEDVEIRHALSEIDFEEIDFDY